MLWTIDRLEGQLAVVENTDGGTLTIPRALLPGDAREGQTYRLVREESQETARSERIRGLMDDLFG